MSDTYRHQLKYKMKGYPRGVVKYCDPNHKGYDDYKISAGKRRRIIGHKANKSFRLAWRKGLKAEQYEVLPNKPRNIGWYLW